ncbi:MULTISPECIES: DUF805 domain-containing protein [unclassified Lysobacter]|uniref:DUF805 domain-containing protein n=1 Tax=unclassified Lysobacter TaxID=2635362 RepID=UPI001C234E13|nr:DUF805 domain-containing protein [Lysobacter sp. MMG2]MBU8977492.1 DUF805 domain-containing protein [Lysobacter sp. MMG2]
MEWFLKVVRNHYFDFNGRARRKEYWMFVLVNVILAVVVSIIANMIKQPWISSVLALALLLPGLGVAARRLHDIGKSGWFILIALIPVVGLYLIYLLAQEGNRGPNAYGPDPKRA